MLSMVYKVNDYLYAGPHPSYGFGEFTNFAKNLCVLETDFGIKQFINLSDERDINSFNLVDYTKTTKNSVSFPFPDMTVPDKEKINNILSFIEKNISIERKVYIHCVAGLGRTGVVIGCHLKSSGIKDPIGEIFKLRDNCTPSYYKSPMTYEQYKFILDF